MSLKCFHALYIIKIDKNFIISIFGNHIIVWGSVSDGYFALACLGVLAGRNSSLCLMLHYDVKDLKKNIWSYKSWF